MERPGSLPGSGGAGATSSAPAEPRQRWRVTFRRRPDAPSLAQREQGAAWEAAVAVSGLPIVGLDLPTPRPRLAFAAPLPVGMAADAELVDLLLSERRPVADVRVRLAGSLPAGHELVDVVDVWLGAPALAGQVAAADYLVELSVPEGAPPIDGRAVEAAIDDVLAAPALPRRRDKGGRMVEYDLRPLLIDVALAAIDPDRAATLRIRTRFDPERGVGRPEEVVAALADAAALDVSPARIVRERLILADED